MALTLALAVVLVGVAAFATGLLPGSRSELLAGVGQGAGNSVPQTSLHWPQNSTAIVSALCKNGTAIFWLPSSNITDSVQAIGQQVQAGCKANVASGLVLSRSQGQDLYQYSVKYVNVTTTVSHK